MHMYVEFNSGTYLLDGSDINFRLGASSVFSPQSLLTCGVETVPGFGFCAWQCVSVGVIAE